MGAKNGEKLSSGPTDPVTNRAVTLEALAKSKLYQIMASVNRDSPFSLGPASMSDTLVGEAISKIRDPRQKMEVFKKMAGKLRELKMDAVVSGKAFGKEYERLPYYPTFSVLRWSCLKAMMS
jgi:hypothetical protein